MSEQPRGHRVSTTSWWSAGAGESGILDLLENELLGIVETGVVDGLSQELARWLRSVGIKLWHVDVIDEEDHLFTSWWTKESLSLGLKVTLEGILQVLG